MPRKALSRNDLKLIAIIAMTIDHLTWTLFPNYTTSIPILILHLIGRLTAPIMCFFVAEGYHHTHNFKAYAKRLFVLAIVSHFAYCFCFALSYVPFKYSIFNGTGIVWSLFFGLLLLKLEDNKKLSSALKLLIILLCCLITLPADWSCVAMMMVFFIGANRGNFKKQMTYMLLMASCYSLVYFIFLDRLYGILQMGVVLSIPLLAKYNGEKGDKAISNKLFYAYYPLHLFILGILRVFLESINYY